MQTTEHLNLNLPEATDPYDIGNENENMEILDSAIYNHGIILGSASTAGHNKIINDLSKTSLSNGEALSARMGNALGQMFAPIESSSTASRAYAIGAQFIYNGILYKATAAISQGGNINPGGNCTAASSVTAQISDLISQLTYKRGDVITMTNLDVYGASNISGNEGWFLFPLNKPLEVIGTVSAYSLDIPFIRGNGVSITSGCTINGIYLLSPGFLGIGINGSFASQTVYVARLTGTITI